MTQIDRIRTEHHTVAMVAFDTVDLITARIKNLLSHDRRISMTRRYTYVNDPPELYVGLRVDKNARHGGIWQWRTDGNAGMGVALTPGLQAFGLAVYSHDGSDTEDAAWDRFRVGKAESDVFSERRRQMTQVEIRGGRDGDGPDREDLIVIREWNGDGVCDERVIAFDNGDAA